VDVELHRIQPATQEKGITRIELVLNWFSELAKQGTGTKH